MIITNTRERIRFFRFAIVGSVGAIIDFGVFNLLTTAVFYFREHAVFAQAISFILAVFSNFTWNRIWTYPDSRSKPLTRQWFQFLLVSLIGLTIRTPIFIGLEEVLVRFFSGWWPKNFLSPIFVAHNAALGVVIGLVMLWNFLANRYWTYNDVGM
ncbi:MAG: GtrA family protein [Chloroflexota bacterium]|jgi:putative flippase GtrA